MKWRQQVDQWEEVILDLESSSEEIISEKGLGKLEIHAQAVKIFFRIHLLRVLIQKNQIFEKVNNNFVTVDFPSFSQKINAKNTLFAWTSTLNSIFSGNEIYRKMELSPTLSTGHFSTYKIVNLQTSPDNRISLIIPNLHSDFPEIIVTKNFNLNSSSSHKISEDFDLWCQSEYDCSFLLNSSSEIAAIIQFSSTSQKTLGAYYTPQKMIQYLVQRQIFLHIWSYAEEKIENPSDSFFDLIRQPPWAFSIIIDYLSKLKLNVSVNQFWIGYFQRLSSVRICDPTCGSGDFLLECFSQWNRLLTKIHKKIQNPELPEYSSKKTTGPHFFGYDIDENAIEAVKNRILVKYLLSGAYKNNRLDSLLSVQVEDFLSIASKNIPPKFDIIIGNPPYLNTIEKIDLRKQLEKDFPQIYHGKLDYCYYFVIAATRCLSKRGLLGFVLKRYFLKSATADRLRRELLKYRIFDIFDHGDYLFFKPAGIQTVILILQTFIPPKQNKKQLAKHSPPFYLKFGDSEDPGVNIWNNLIIRPINIYQMKNRWLIPSKASWGEFQGIQEEYKTLFEYTLQDFLITNYSTEGGLESDPIDAIQSQKNYRFTATSEIPDKIQRISLFKLVKGIQTGKDQIFVVPKTSIPDAERERIKPFIKGKNISPYNIHPSEKEVIISNRYAPILGEKYGSDPKYPNIEQYLEENKTLLQNRSRAKDGDWAFWRKGDERSTVDFEFPKIVWPYRGPNYYVAIDNQGYYHSQDVILLTLNIKEIEKKFSSSPVYIDLFRAICKDWTDFGIYFYQGLLNSEIFEKLLKYRAKEFAKKVYDFQPNNFHHIRIPLYCRNDPKHQELVNLSKSIEVHYESMGKAEDFDQKQKKLNQIAKAIILE